MVEESVAVVNVVPSSVCKTHWLLQKIVSIFSSAWLYQQSSCNRSSSVVGPFVHRPSMSQLSLTLIHGFLWNFSCCFLLVIRQDLFEFLKKMGRGRIFYEYFSLSLTWDPIRTKMSKLYSSYKSQPKVFKLFLNFLPNDPHKTTFGVIEIFKI